MLVVCMVLSKGVSNFKEVNRSVKLNPLSADSDGDGFSDRLELAYWNTNPAVAECLLVKGVVDGSLAGPCSAAALAAIAAPFAGTEYAAYLIDTDGDGLTDFAESKLGTDPKQKDTDGDGT